MRQLSRHPLGGKQKVKRHIYFILTLSFLICTLASSQSIIEVFTGIHYSSGQNHDYWNNFLENYWKPSLIIGARSTIPLTNYFSLSPSASYNYYFFNNYYEQGVSIPEEKFVALSGENSNVLRIMVDLNLISRTDAIVKPYLTLGGGFINENIGIIHGRMEYLGRPEYSKDIGGTNNHYLVYTVGVGSSISLSEELHLDISAKYYSNTNDRMYLLYNLGIAYKILN